MTVARLSLGLACLLVLGVTAGCSKPKAPDSVSASTEATAKPEGTTATAGVNPMLQKPGLWEITTAMQGMPKGIVSQICVDQALSGRMAELGVKGMAGDTHCTQSNVVKTGATVDIDSVCQMSGHTINSHIHMEMVSDSAYHQTVTSTMTPPMTGDGKSSTEITGKRTGDCPADMKGGDMIMPGGMKMNMYDALNRVAASK